METRICDQSPKLSHEQDIKSIERLKELLKADSTLKPLLADDFLLRFIRAKRGDVNRAAESIKNYYKLQSTQHQLFTAPSKLKHVFGANVCQVLDHKTEKDEAVFLFQAGRWEPKNYSFDMLISSCVVSMEKAIEDETTQLNGIVGLVDMTGFGWKHLKHFGPLQARRIVHIIEECLPINFNSIHVVHESTIADIAFTVMRPFLSEELRNKIQFHGHDMKRLHKIIDPTYLPVEIHGTAGQMDASEWYHKVCQSELFFDQAWNHYGYVGHKSK